MWATLCCTGWMSLTTRTPGVLEPEPIKSVRDESKLIPSSMLSSLHFPLALVASRAGPPKMETVADLETLAKKCNPVVGFYDPLGLAQAGLADNAPFSEAEAIGFLRHAEIKHGRVAMAAFVGFIAQSNTHFPWNLQGGLSHAEIFAAGSPPAQWDALPTSAKLQILGFIGLLEFFGEKQQPHYMRGGKPGAYPTFDAAGVPHPVPLNLWDPFGFTKKMSPERKEKALVAEINNGRLAQIGIIGFLSASKGCIVPGLDGVGIKPYAGEVMAPFAANDNLPFVQEMLQWKLPITLP